MWMAGKAMVDRGTEGRLVRGGEGRRGGGSRGRGEASCKLIDQLDAPRDQSRIMLTPQTRPLSTER